MNIEPLLSLCDAIEGVELAAAAFVEATETRDEKAMERAYRDLKTAVDALGCARGAHHVCLDLTVAPSLRVLRGGLA